MIILVGESGAGKTTVENMLVGMGMERIISYTTRKPRDGEVNGEDYHFISMDEFHEMIRNKELMEYTEYSQGRFYGTKYEDYLKSNAVVVLTPSGLRDVRARLEHLALRELIAVYVTANLGNRMLRYIQRVGVDKFDFDSKVS